MTRETLAIALVAVDLRIRELRRARELRDEWEYVDHHLDNDLADHERAREELRALFWGRPSLLRRAWDWLAEPFREEEPLDVPPGLEDIHELSGGKLPEPRK